MAYGLMVFNLNDLLQIDDAYDNMAVKQTGLLGNGSVITPPTATQLLLVRPSSATGTIHLGATAGGVSFQSSSGYTSYVLLDRGAALAETLSPHGLIVRNGNGVVFDSGRAYANPLAMVTVSTLAGSSATVNLPTSLKQRYVVFGGLFQTQYYFNGYQGLVYGPVVNFVSATQVAVGISVINSNGPPTDAGPFGTTRSLLIMEA